VPNLRQLLLGLCFALTLPAAGAIAPPIVTLHTPAENAAVTAPTAVVATVQDTTLTGWTLRLAATGVNEAPQVIAQGSGPLSQQPAGTLDPTLLGSARDMCKFLSQGRSRDRSGVVSGPVELADHPYPRNIGRSGGCVHACKG
jgi:hypothetical protein